MEPRKEYEYKYFFGGSVDGMLDFLEKHGKEGYRVISHHSTRAYNEIIMEKVK